MLWGAGGEGGDRRGGVTIRDEVEESRHTRPGYGL